MINFEKAKENIKNLDILYVEDDELLYDINAESLNIFFNEVFIAHNGLEGLNVFSEHSNIPIILTDINMPEMNGIDMIKKIKENHPNTLIIATTAYDENTLLNIDKNYTEYFDLIVEKPFQLPNIISYIVDNIDKIETKI